jgi:hypothetical protein
MATVNKPPFRCCCFESELAVSPKKPGVEPKDCLFGLTAAIIVSFRLMPTFGAVKTTTPAVLRLSRIYIVTFLFSKTIDNKMLMFEARDEAGELGPFGP